MRDLFMAELAGPLAGIRVLELAGLGPAPFACMVLADLGADVLRIDRPGGGTLIGAPQHDLLNRGRPSAVIDVKTAAGAAVVRQLADAADVFVEGFRPGVAEGMGLGPDELCVSNPRLVYGRMTGWGQRGPLAQSVGHDINYAAIAGALGAIGEADRKPVPPLNLVADFGGGAMFLLTGVLAALVERSVSGRGQVVDAAMVDGTAMLLAMTYGLRASGSWTDQRGSNILDGGAPFYDTYTCADGRYLAVGAIEPRFYRAFLDGLATVDKAAATALPSQMDIGCWDELRGGIQAILAQRDCPFWLELFEGTEACVAPVLSLAEAPEHPHLVARSTYVTGPTGAVQPAPAPRFSRTPGGLSTPPAWPGADTRSALSHWGIDAAVIEQLLADGVAVQL